MGAEIKWRQGSGSKTQPLSLHPPAVLEDLLTLLLFIPFMLHSARWGDLPNAAAGPNQVAAGFEAGRHEEEEEGVWGRGGGELSSPRAGQLEPNEVCQPISRDFTFFAAKKKPRNNFFYFFFLLFFTVQSRSDEGLIWWRRTTSQTAHLNPLQRPLNRPNKGTQPCTNGINVLVFFWPTALGDLSLSAPAPCSVSQLRSCLLGGPRAAALCGRLLLLSPAYFTFIIVEIRLLSFYCLFIIINR